MVAVLFSMHIEKKCCLPCLFVCLVCLSALFGTEMKIEEEAEGRVA